MSFEGTAQTKGQAVDPDAPFGMDYEFRVERVIEGEVRPSEQVRFVPGAGSMCGSGPRLVRGGRYRINASVSALPSGRRLLNVNWCSGSAELLAAPPEGGSKANRWVLTAVAALAIATTGALLSRRRHPPSA